MACGRKIIMLEVFIVQAIIGIMAVFVKTEQGFKAAGFLPLLFMMFDSEISIEDNCFIIRVLL